MSIEQTVAAELKRGDRVALSPKAAERLIRKGREKQLGIFQSVSKAGVARVVWDGTKGPDQIHISFIAKVEEEMYTVKYRGLEVKCDTPGEVDQIAGASKRRCITCKGELDGRSIAYCEKHRIARNATVRRLRQARKQNPR